eukprot:gnl/TRDRNA2_/TRDRNA2_177310_c3_seq4.p1 gnl/TRDRNA2_/TRDRNA2_177310_c3~~gnl/TRDRNA2_/TRDRNA2_177310_c3_seq4.p1  ORF type:complete len:244 (+),score=39.00 gnl/TRDRNA2_/TRDRNA2_177310_c3_seq4:89-820(+)
MTSLTMNIVLLSCVMHFACGARVQEATKLQKIMQQGVTMIDTSKQHQDQVKNRDLHENEDRDLGQTVLEKEDQDRAKTVLDIKDRDRDQTALDNEDQDRDETALENEDGDRDKIRTRDPDDEDDDDILVMSSDFCHGQDVSECERKCVRPAQFFPTTGELRLGRRPPPPHRNYRLETTVTFDVENICDDTFPEFEDEFVGSYYYTISDDKPHREQSKEELELLTKWYVKCSKCLSKVAFGLIQ